MDPTQPTEDEKTAYFGLLGSLNSPATDDDDFGEWEQRHRQRCRNFFRPCTPPETVSFGSKDTTAPARDRNGVVRRLHSAPIDGPMTAARVIASTQTRGPVAPKGRLRTLLGTEPPRSDETIIPETERPAHKSLRRSDSTPMMPTKTLSLDVGEPSPSLGMGLRKRKRGPGPKPRPEKEQVFKGLAFFYIPDNDIAPARRLRMAKAREYGALWTRSPSTATHIVVDRNLSYNDVEKVVCMSNSACLPTLVNEDYPIDCIQFRSLLDHNQIKYRIAGQPRGVADARQDLAAGPVRSAEALQLELKEGDPMRRNHICQPSSSREDDTSTHESIIDTTAARQTTTLETSHDSGHAPGPDELAGVIDMMQEFKHLPLDKDDDEAARSDLDASTTESGGADKSDAELDELRDNETQEPRLDSRRKPGKFEDRFACHHAGEKDDYASNLNARTIQVLQQMANYYERIHYHWRTTGYRKAITTLKRQQTKISTEEEAFRLPHIGRRIAQKIEEIVTTDRLRRLEYAQDEATDGVLQLFLKIYGVGSSQARRWIAQGYRTLDDVARQAKLTPNQKIGIEHYHDLATRMPRREVEAHGAVVRQAAARLDADVELIVGGGYRRGAETSHDIDLMVTKKGTRSLGELRPFLDSLVGQLEKDGFLVARLASSRTSSDGSTWHGCCVLPAAAAAAAGVARDEDRAVWRRIDFLLVPATERGAALIYFTGNDLFNRSMRLLASKRGMRLNQRGLYKNVLPGPHSGGGGNSRSLEGALVEGQDERRIFEVLGVRWREPHERWC